MSAASPAHPQVRRTATAAPSRAPQAASEQHAHTSERKVTQVFDFSKPKGDDELRVNLADVPVMRTSLDAEVFAPTLLSRLMDLFGPRR
ncbi:MAG: hypothetical protein SXG53_26275 [Pseudomonadota bacterium]|nr:hypothetical protein [Pseudomonadota bacterium]